MGTLNENQIRPDLPSKFTTYIFLFYFFNKTVIRGKLNLGLSVLKKKNKTKQNKTKQNNKIKKK